MVISRHEFGDFVHVLEADGAQYFMSGTRGTFFQPGNLLEEVCRRRRFCDKSERPVWLDVNHSGDWNAGFNVGSPRVELFAKVHGFDTTRTERWADGRTWGCLSGTNQETLKERRLSILDFWTGKPTDNQMNLTFGHGARPWLGLLLIRALCRPNKDQHEERNVACHTYQTRFPTAHHHIHYRVK